jgi:hypothetical protein
MFGIVRDKPIGAARYWGKQDRNIRRITNQMASGSHFGLSWKRNHLRLHQRDRVDILIQHPVHLAGFNSAQAEQKILFDLLAHGFGENQLRSERMALSDPRSRLCQRSRHWSRGESGRVPLDSMTLATPRSGAAPCKFRIVSKEDASPRLGQGIKQIRGGRGAGAPTRKRWSRRVTETGSAPGSA